MARNRNPIRARGIIYNLAPSSLYNSHGHSFIDFVSSWGFIRQTPNEYEPGKVGLVTNLRGSPPTIIQGPFAWRIEGEKQ